MTPSSPMRRSKRKAARIFTLLFVIVMVGFYFTIGADVVGFGGAWGAFVLLGVLLLLIALGFVI